MAQSNHTIFINTSKLSVGFLICISFLLLVVSFPAIDPEYGIGLDTSYVWAFNHLFDAHRDILPTLVYPIGPLGFLRMPITIGNNLAIAIAFLCIIKVWFLSLFIQNSLENGHSRFTSILLATIIALYSSVDYLLIGLTAIYAFKYLLERGKMNVVIAAGISLLALSMKVSVGVCAGLTIFMALLITAIRDRSTKEVFNDTLPALMLVLALGWLIFGSPEVLVQYFTHSLLFSLGFSGALSMKGAYTSSGLFYVLLCIPLTWYFIRDEKFRHTWWMLLPSLFAAWKHGMSRQDVSHGNQFLYFLILYWCLLYSFSNVRKLMIIVFGIICLTNFNSQLGQMEAYQGFHLQKDGFDNFIKTIPHIKEYTAEWNEKSKRNIAAAKVDESTRNLVGNATIDTYPWELSYMYGLNWKPRRTLQSGSFAIWLEKISAEDFNHTNGPEFLLWHYVQDPSGSNLTSIDNRYLLNENPLTLISLLRNYRLEEKTDRYLLYHKRNQELSYTTSTLSIPAIQFNEWAKVPLDNHGLVRLNLSINSELTEKLSGFMYLPAEYYIDYKMDNFRVMSYRFNPQMSLEGLWINPFILFVDANVEEPKVTAIRIRSNKEQSTIANVQFLSYSFYKDSVIFTANDFFGKTTPLLKNTIVDTILISTPTILPPQGFSTTYKISLDSLWKLTDQNHLLVETDAVFSAPTPNGAVVISIEESPVNDYKGRDFNTLPGYALQSLLLSREKQPTGKMVIYIWNNGINKVEVKGLRVRVR